MSVKQELDIIFVRKETWGRKTLNEYDDKKFPGIEKLKIQGISSNNFSSKVMKSVTARLTDLHPLQVGPTKVGVPAAIRLSGQ